MSLEVDVATVATSDILPEEAVTSVAANRDKVLSRFLLVEGEWSAEVPTGSQ